MFNDSPALLELEGLSDDQKLWLEFEDKVRTIGRALVASPGVPADRVAFLRAAQIPLVTVKITPGPHEFTLVPSLRYIDLTNQTIYHRFIEEGSIRVR